jgi:hypothetical protein
MIELEDLPDHVLRTIVSLVIDATQFKGWQLSLRQVNRKFGLTFERAPTYTNPLVRPIQRGRVACVLCAEEIFC